MLRSAAGGPVIVKLRFERKKTRESGEGFILVSEETEIEVHPSEGLDIFKFQVRPPLPTPDPPADTRRLPCLQLTTPCYRRQTRWNCCRLVTMRGVLRKRKGYRFSRYPFFLRWFVHAPLRRVIYFTAAVTSRKLTRFPFEPSVAARRGLSFFRCSRLPTSNLTSKRSPEATPTGRSTPTLPSPPLCRERAVACTVITPS